MKKSTTRAFLAHSSATKRSFFLLLGLTVVSTGQGSGKLQVSYVYSLFVCIEFTYGSLLTIIQICSGSVFVFGMIEDKLET